MGALKGGNWRVRMFNAEVKANGKWTCVRVGNT